MTDAVAERVADEGSHAHAPVGELALDVAHRQIVVPSQNQVADQRAGHSDDDSPPGQLFEGLKDLVPAVLLELAAQDHDRRHEQDQAQHGQNAVQPLAEWMMCWARLVRCHWPVSLSNASGFRGSGGLSSWTPRPPTTARCGRPASTLHPAA